MVHKIIMMNNMNDNGVIWDGELYMVNFFLEAIAASLQTYHTAYH